MDDDDKEVCAICQDEGWRINGLSYWQELQILICASCDFWMGVVKLEDTTEVLLNRGLIDVTAAH